MRSAALFVVLILAGSAHADVASQETIVAKAAVRLGAALQNDDPKELDAATLAETKATKELASWLAKHPKDRTDQLARIVTAATKLGEAADRLRGLVAMKADGALLQQAAIDGLHRYNEFISAHQGDPAPKEIPIPDELRERYLRMMERIGDDVVANKPDCKKIGAALMKHADEDVKIVDELQTIDDARPQDQREAERVSPPRETVRRLTAARERMVPLKACKDDATIGAYRARTNL